MTYIQSEIVSMWPCDFFFFFFFILSRSIQLLARGPSYSERPEAAIQVHGARPRILVKHLPVGKHLKVVTVARVRVPVVNNMSINNFFYKN
jgi:hypothetical protein